MTVAMTVTVEQPDKVAGCDIAVVQHDEENHTDSSNVEVRVALRKVDKRLVPLLALLYLLAFLDRGNVGNARTLGMQKDLGITNPQWNICLTIFFFPYSILEVPSNMVLKVLKPSIWLSLLVISWGIVTTLTGIVQNYHGLAIARVFLGVTESGFFPAATYLLTCWYLRFELQSRLAMFFCTGSLAGAFSGLLAYAINKMDGVSGLPGWRWIFILEGILTTMTGFLVFWLLPDSPSTAKFLTPRERDLLCQRLKGDSGGTGNVQTAEPFQMKYLIAALTDWKVWLSVVVYWGNSISVYGFIYTLPSVIHQLGYTAEDAQLLTIPVYIFAMIVTLSAAFLSDRLRNRSNFIIYPFMVAALGYIALLAVPHPSYPGLTYGMLFVVAAGLYPVICGILSWNANNLAGSWKRSIGMGLQIAIGNLGGAVGSNIYLAEQAPHYWLGYGFSLGIISAAIASALLLRHFLQRENLRREKLSPEEVEQMYSETELLEMGDRDPRFRYTL